MTEIEAAIRKIRARIKVLHADARELRDQHLLDCLHIAREVSQEQKASIIQRIRQQERRNEAYSRLKYYRGKTVKSQSIDHVIIPKSWTEKEEDEPLEDPKELYKDKDRRKDPNAWIEIKSPPEILYYTKMRNRQHFGQAETDGTPFTQEPLKTKFNWKASTNEAELVLEGNYTDDDLTTVQ